MSEQKTLRAAACTAAPGERVVRGVVAVIVAAFAVAFTPVQPLIGIAAGVLAIGIGAMAITGFCPADWLRARAGQRQTPPNSLGYEDARGLISLETATHKEYSS